MKNLIHLFLILFIASCAIGINTSCSDDSNCSMAGRPMMYCKLMTIDPETGKSKNDTLDSLTITALGTDSIILNNEKNVHKLMIPLRYTSDSTVLIFKYDPIRQPKHTDTLYIIQKNTPYFQSMECGYLMKQSILNAVIGKHGSNTQVEKMDSIYIRDKEANSNEIQNLQIFYVYRDRTPIEIQ